MQSLFKFKSEATTARQVTQFLGGLLIGLFVITNTCFAKAALVPAKLDEQVVMIPVGYGAAGVQLETTIFKPPGPGPFPLVIMNHGKALGNPHSQARDRFIVLSKEFVKRGYAVVIPMRKGFSKSTGDYVEHVCDMAANGQDQANDLQNALEYVVRQSWADKDRIVVAGQSYGGLATMAFGTRHFPGVKGLINFAGGLRIHGGSCEWQANLVAAFGEFGAKTNIPSLWFYGENDSHFDPALASRMHDAYVRSGNQARLVAFGPFKKDAHGMSSSPAGVRVWWPETEKFLAQIGMPTEETVALTDELKKPKTDFAALDNVDAIPYLKEKGRAAYREFLGQPMPRAFAVSSSGAWSWAEDGEDPAAQVLANCQKSSVQPCKLYAINSDVVWSNEP
jgi:dienelactone hydrolase